MRNTRTSGRRRQNHRKSWQEDSLELPRVGRRLQSRRPFVSIAPGSVRPKFTHPRSLGLDRRRSDKYRQQLKAAPQVLVVRDTHYVFNPANGMGSHYGWLDGKIANLHVSFSELVAYAYGNQYARTEFPEQWTHGRLTNRFF